MVVRMMVVERHWTVVSVMQARSVKTTSVWHLQAVVMARVMRMQERTARAVLRIVDVRMARCAIRAAAVLQRRVMI